MKRALNAPLWLFPILLLVMGCLYFGCKKNDLPPDKHAQAVKTFDSVKTDFNRQGLSAKLTSEINDSMSLTLVPNWDEGFTIYDTDSNLCYYLPISGKIKLKKKNETANVTFDKVVRYLIGRKKGNKLEFYQTTVIPKDPEDKRNSFSGDMLVYSLADNRKAIFTYDRGELAKGNYNTRQSHQDASQTALEYGCLYYHECTWTSPCDGTFTVVYTRGQGHPSQILDCGIPSLSQCLSAVWTVTGNGWQVFCNNDPIDPLPPVYPPPGGTSGGGGGPVVDPIHPSYNDFKYICPQEFVFVITTTHELWQTACIATAHCNIKFYDGDSRQYVERHVEVPKMYFQGPYKDTFGIVVLTPYLATLYAAQAFNDGENAMHDAFKADIYLTSSQLSSLWLSTANSIFMGLTRGQGRVTATPPFNSINPIPVVQYVACP